LPAAPRMERAGGDRAHQALEPGPHLAARLVGEARDRGVAPALEPYRAVLEPLRIRELRAPPVRGEPRGDLDPRPLVIAVGADLVGQRPRPDLAAPDGAVGGGPC